MLLRVPPDATAFHIIKVKTERHLSTLDNGDTAETESLNGDPKSIDGQLPNRHPHCENVHATEEQLRRCALT